MTESVTENEEADIIEDTEESLPPIESGALSAPDSKTLKDADTFITDDGNNFLDLLLQLEQKEAEIDELTEKTQELENKIKSNNRTINDLRQEKNKLKNEKKQLNKKLQIMPTVEILLAEQDKLNHRLFKTEEKLKRYENDKVMAIATSLEESKKMLQGIAFSIKMIFKR